MADLGAIGLSVISNYSVGWCSFSREKKRSYMTMSYNWLHAQLVGLKCSRTRPLCLDCGRSVGVPLASKFEHFKRSIKRLV